MSENPLVDALRAVNNSPGFRVFRDFMSERRTACLELLADRERCDSTDVVNYLQGQALVYQSLTKLFDHDLPLLVQQQAEDKLREASDNADNLKEFRRDL